MDTKLIYLATPYTTYRDGMPMAFIDAARLSARLMQNGVVTYSPVVNTHPMATYGNIRPESSNPVWLSFDRLMMDKADEILVATMPGWETSKGITHEIEVFRDAGKPIRFVHPETLEITP